MRPDCRTPEQTAAAPSHFSLTGQRIPATSLIRCSGTLIALSREVMPCADELPTGVKRALEEIVRYMVSQPDAKDTAQGIHDWWLPVSDDDCTLAEVEQAVESLTRWGWLTEQRLADQIVVYGPSQEGLQKGVLYLRGAGTD